MTQRDERHGRRRVQHFIAHQLSPLRVRLLVIALLVALPLLVLFAYSTREQHELDQERAEQAVERAAYLIAQNEDRLIAGIRPLLAVIAGADAVRGPGCTDYLDTIVNADSSLVSITVSAPDGTVVCAGGRASLGRTELDDIRDGARRRGFVVGEYRLRPGGGTGVLPIGYSPLEGEGRGDLVVALVDAGWVLKAARQAGFDDGDRLSVVGPGSEVLARYPDPEGFTGGVTRSPVTDAALRGTTRAVALRGVDGVERLWAFQPLGDGDRPSAHLALGLSSESLFRRSEQLSQQVLVAMVFAVVVALLMGAMVARFLVERPVRKLASAARRVGAGDLDLRFAAGKQGELADLATSFNVMVDRLQDHVQRVLNAERRFRVSFDHAPIGMALLELPAGDPPRIVEVNGSLCHLADVEAEDLRSQRAAGLVHPDDRDELVAELEQVRLGQLECVESERRLQRPGGEVRWTRTVIARVENEDGGPAFALMQVEDVTDARHARQHLEQLALYDPLTLLPNRTLAMDRVGQALARTARTGNPFGILFIDLDRFKVVNDSLGHHAGDALLVEVARRLRRTVRKFDTAARLGGDEFLVCCENLGPGRTIAESTLSALAERIALALAEPFELEDRQLTVPASIGMAIPDDPTTSAEMLLRDADIAMYRAKRSGGGRAELFAVGLRDVALVRLDIESGLRRALTDDQLEVHYQPVVDLATQTVIGAEALLRWRHPERGLVGPADLITIAEETGLIVPIGEFVLRTALRDAAAWRCDGLDLTVTVNVSPVQLAQSDLAVTVAQLLEDAQLPASAVGLELTETALLHVTGPALKQLSTLRALGVRIGVDDFGTGYASLASLRQLPVTFVKIDRSFVAGIANESKDAAVVRAIVGLGRDLGLSVVAEGVEEDAQADVLVDLGCERAQGFRFSRPQPNEDFLRVVGVLRHP